MTSPIRQHAWIVLFSIAVASALTPSVVRAQLFSGPSIDGCSTQGVDSTNEVDITVCVSGSSSGLDIYAETDGGDDYQTVLETGAQLEVYDGNTLVFNSGSNYSSYAYVYLTPHINDVYTINGLAYELYDPSQSGDFTDAYWINVGTDTIEAQIFVEPVITSMSVHGAGVGTQGSFTITGTDLVDSSGASHATISGGATASVASGATATQESINYSIPSNAAFGPQTLTISNSQGSGTAAFLFQQNPVIAWPAPQPIGAGTPLSEIQLNAIANVPGDSFVYSPAAGAVLSAGTHTLSVVFTPTDNTDYATAIASTTIDVQDAPVIDWPTPAAISYGTALSSAQLDASATYGGSSIPGTYAYSPPAGTVLGAGLQTLTVTFTPSNQTLYGVLSGSVTLLVNNTSTQPASIYSYCIPGPSNPNCNSATSGYAPNGNILSYTDSVAGAWSLGYDALNRLTSASATAGYFSNLQIAWGYDSFGNLKSESFGGNPQISMPTSSSAGYNAANLVSSSSLMLGAALPYDAAGDVTQDNKNAYLYDAEGRICAVKVLPSGPMTEYIYDAEGTRVAKGTITSWSCNSAQNGFTPTRSYVIGPNGEQLTEETVTSGQSAWAHSNVYAAGQLIATYDQDPKSNTQALHFQLADWLGTRRVQTDYAGNSEENCTSLPFGDDLNCQPTTLSTADDATEQHFTGKERDAESGNDYFEARYYGSTMGRFLSPDPGPYLVPDPQSWNRYAYVQNNPLRNTDPTGRILQIGGESGQQLVDMLSKKSGLHLVPDKKGHLEAKGKRDKNGTNGELAKQIQRAISSDKVVNITANQGESPTNNFFDDNETRTVDMSDFSKTDSQAPDLATVLLDHVMSEYTDMAEGKDFFDAHQEALKSEAKAMSDVTGHKEGPVQHIDDANPLMKFVYSTVQYNVLIKEGPTGTTDIDTVTKVPVEGDKKP